MIDAATGLFKIKASVENGDALPTGSVVSLYVVSERASQVMCIPVDAIYYSGGDAYVYTYSGGVVRRLPVEVGIYDSVQAQILSGLDMTDQVITTWSSELVEGVEVKVVGEVDRDGLALEETGLEPGSEADFEQQEDAQAE